MARSLRPIDVFPITVRELEVLRVADVTSGMRRVTLGGEGLKAHTAPSGYPVADFRSDGFDDEFKLFLQHPDAAEPSVPEQLDGVLHWPRTDPHLLFRTYTARRWDREAGELDVDFVVHGVGPATSWARRVQPGERVHIAGPKSSAPHPVGADWTLVAGDDTALPAIGRWLEEWPDGARGQVFIEIARPEHRQELPVPDGVEITWLSRDGAEPGTTTLLLDALQAAHWWEGTVFAWVAGEALTLTPIRRWLRNEKELPKEQVEVTGYWRREEVVLSEENAGVQDLDASEDVAENLHELLEIFPGFAVRVAASIGLPEAIGASALPFPELVTATGAGAVGLGKLLRYLAAIDIVEQDGDGRFGLTAMGRLLDNEYLTENLSLDGVEAQRELGAALSLLSAIRTGTGDHERWFGAGYAERELGDRALLAERVEAEAEMAVYVTGAAAEADAFAGVTSIAVAGRAASSFAVALVEAHPERRATVIGAPSELAALRAVSGEHDRVAYQPGSVMAGFTGDFDAVLLADVLHEHGDVDAVHVLSAAAASVGAGGRVIVFGELLLPDRADDHDFEHDLIDFALHGGGSRTAEEQLALFAAAGLPEPQRSTAGWGYSLFVSTLAG